MKLKFSLGIIFSLLLIFTFSSTSNASEKISLPNINNLSTSYDTVIPLQSNPERQDILVANREHAYIMDLISGNKLRTIQPQKYYLNYLSTDVLNNYFVYQDDYDYSFNYTYKYISNLLYSTKGTNGNKLPFMGYPLGFLANSSTLIIIGIKEEPENEYIDMYDEKIALYGYDLDRKKVVFKRNLPNYDLYAFNKEIVFANDKNLMIYDANGNYQDVMEFNSKITDLHFTEDGSKLVVATSADTLQIIDTKNYSLDKKLPFINSNKADLLTIDSTNKYLALSDENYHFKLYDFTNGKRIYTSEDSKTTGGGIALSKNAKFILNNGSVYSGKNLTSYIQSVELPNNLKTIELGQSYSPTLTANRANGTNDLITSGIEWHTDNYNIAYIDGGKNLLIPRKTGEFTLYSTYLDEKIKNRVKVVDTKKPVFEGVKNLTFYANQGIKSMHGMTAKDLGDGDVTSKVKVSGSFNANKAGVYKLSYSVTDSAGNTATAKRTITIKYNPLKNAFLYDKYFYLSNSSYNKKGSGISPFLVSSYVYKKGKTISPIMEIDVKNIINNPFKTIVFKSNGKQLTINIKGSKYYKSTEYGFYNLSTKDRNWIKSNVAANKTLTVQINASRKNLKSTLNAKQKQGLLDGVLLYDYFTGK
ncbi:hypothetical protein KZO01_07800 [Kurthia zopfii]|uniref:Uncharacterized protein DUF5011 n=1 Tax=Kurthia zopfii TaxID=1650 RepID=A0A8B4Q5P9_9BACL|nr:DUF5011 domain-containing protein [Kurthia zopfii]PWI22402.1 hypothetical protein DF281_07370 [Kurthia zopfii]TDR38468.1 uncharacterized protein DUF5011 [Kurthia zopfii]GEK30471.1 hypothetical protein KZO01_07800 [Kurthia zopfii]STX08558.1 Uncharacterised protein [Kurthia zopfii]